MASAGVPPALGEVDALSVRLERVRELLDTGRGRYRRHRADLRVAGAEREQRGLQVGHGAPGNAAEVGLGDDEHVGHLHDPRLQELEHVAGGGLDDDRDRVGDVGHLGLRLADADGLDHDHVECGGERFGRRARGGGKAAEAGARGGRADEHVAVVRVDLDPGPVAEQRAAGAPRARIDRQHGDRPVMRAPVLDELREQ